MTPLVGLLVLLLTPLVPFGLAMLLLMRRNSRTLQIAAALAALPALVTSVLMPSGIAATLPWLLEGSEFGLDDVGRLFLFFSATIWLAAGIYACRSIDARERGRFMVLFLLVMSGNLGVIVARDMLSFYLFFVLMSFSSYGLVVHDRSAESKRAGRIYMMLVVAGDMMLFAALVLAALDTGGTLLFGAVREAIAASPFHDTIVALVLLGFGVKVGVLGLHFVLPLVYRAAPPPAAAVFAGAMISAGLLGWLRFLPFDTGAAAWGGALIAAGVAAAFFGAAVGVTQRRIAPVLAYSSISQMGLMTAGVGAALVSPGHSEVLVAAVAVYAMHHALAKSTLFLGADLATGLPVAGPVGVGVHAGLLLPALALAGAPLTSGMLAKEYLKEALVEVPDARVEMFAALLPWTAFATTLIAARFLLLVWRADAARSTVGTLDSTAEPLDRRSATPGIAKLLAWALMLGMTAGGVWLLPIADPPQLFTAAVLFELTWPVALGIAVAAAFVSAGKNQGPLARRIARAASAVPEGDVVVALTSVARAVRGAWSVVAKQRLPAARDRILGSVRAAYRAGVWLRAAAAVEDVLGDWSVALTLFVALIVALTIATAWL